MVRLKNQHERSCETEFYLCSLTITKSGVQPWSYLSFLLNFWGALGAPSIFIWQRKTSIYVFNLPTHLTNITSKVKNPLLKNTHIIRFLIFKIWGFLTLSFCSAFFFNGQWKSMNQISIHTTKKSCCVSIKCWNFGVMMCQHDKNLRNIVTYVKWWMVRNKTGFLAEGGWTRYFSDCHFFFEKGKHVIWP